MSGLKWCEIQLPS